MQEECVEILKEYSVNAKHKKYDKTVKVPAVVPIVLYNGEHVWDAPKQFRKMIGQSYVAPRWAFGFQQVGITDVAVEISVFGQFAVASCTPFSKVSVYFAAHIFAASHAYYAEHTDWDRNFMFVCHRESSSSMIVVHRVRGL